MSHIVSKELFKKFKERNETLKSEDLDPGVVEVVNLLNQHPEIATVWTCQGHHDPDTDSDSGYILMATTNQDVLDRLFGLFIVDYKEEITASGLAQYFELTKAIRLQPWVARLDLQGKNDSSIWYNAWSLRWENGEKYPVEFWMSRLANTVQQLLTELRVEKTEPIMTANLRNYSVISEEDIPDFVSSELYPVEFIKQHDASYTEFKNINISCGIIQGKGFLVHEDEGNRLEVRITVNPSDGVATALFYYFLDGVFIEKLPVFNIDLEYTCTMSKE